MGLQNFDPGTFDFLWASPPCTEYSIARTTARTPRDFNGADAVVSKALEIIEYFGPLLWLMENPQTGYLKSRTIMADIPFQDVTYCKYGFPYMKQTRLWGCFPFGLRPVCCPADPCQNMEGGKHITTAQRGSGLDLRELYRIPPELCNEIATIATSWTR